MASEKSFEKSAKFDFEDDGQPGRAPAAHDFELDSKMGQPEKHSEAIDEKADRPPRFSTLFGVAPPPPPPAAAPREYVREYHPRPEKKRGIYMPLPLFIIFMVIIFFESTLLFAYTIIGLYNNAPSRLFPWAGTGSVATCDMMGEKQPSINVAPNFVLPQAGGAVTQLVTITAPPPSTQTTNTPTSENPAAAVSEIAGIFSGLAGAESSSSSSSSSIVFVTISPTRSTVTSVTFITSTAPGSATSSQPRPTVTLTTMVDPPKATE